RDVETALARNELVVVYQPILELSSGQTRAVEALVRRLLPDHALLPPGEFIPHVERTPVVRELTFTVVSEALHAAAGWSVEAPDPSASVNAPYPLLDAPRFAEGLAELLEASTVAAERLTLEVVPAGPGAGLELDDDVLGRLKALGLRLSLDDGGRAASF